MQMFGQLSVRGFQALVRVVVVLFLFSALLFCGARHATNVDTVDGGTASEIQLVKAFAFSGLQYPSQIAAPPPPRLDDPAASAEALDRWAKQQVNAVPPAWKVRVDTSAKTPCPT